MPNPNNCQTCGYKNVTVDGKPVEGHCYMFSDEPDEVCMQHTHRKGPVAFVGGGSTLTAAIALAALLGGGRAFKFDD